MDLAIYLPYNFIKENPSIRLRKLNIRKPLRKLDVKADIIFRFEDLLNFKNILVSHYDEQCMKELIQLRLLGKKLFYDHTENMWNFPYQEEVFNLCDYIVCCSKKLAEITQSNLKSGFTKCIVIPDMYETTTERHQPRETNELVVGYCGMGGNAIHARELKPIIQKLDMQLIIISEHDDADIKWSRETYLEEMSKFDIAICPQNVALQPAKSSVKVVTAMSLGLPVIASPNPAYLEIIKNGENGFIASQPSEWEAALTQLKDFHLRKKFSDNALKTASNFSPEEIARKWRLSLLETRLKIGLINNTLQQKYLSYGDYIQDNLKLGGFEVENFRYEDIDILPQNLNYYLFIEKRYDPEDISDVSPRILFTQEEQNLNNLPHFDLIVTTQPKLYQAWKERGFVNIILVRDLPKTKQNFDSIFEMTKKDFISERKKHNEKLHSDHINAFYNLQLPEDRWNGGSRDRIHIEYTEKHLKPNCRVLDIGSADGWLALKLATHSGVRVSALEFVDRGIEWTEKHAKRLGVDIDLRKGFIEDVGKVFIDSLLDLKAKYDLILCYEILEHLDYRKIPWYLEKIEELLDESGKVLVSLPKQDLHDNKEHLWSPSEKLIKQLFKNKNNCQIEWRDIPNHEISGNWFISYEKR